MSTRTQLLVVRPRSGSVLAPSEEHLTNLVHDFLGTKPLSGWQRTLVSTTTVFPVRQLAGLAMKNLRVEDAMPVLRELARSIFARSPELVDPELEVILEGDASLADLVVLGGTGFRPNVVYAMHPLRHGSYLAIADFHRYLLDEKRSEFERLAAALGAKEVRMLERAAASQVTDARASASVPSSSGIVDVGADMHKAMDQSSSFSLEASFDPPSTTPRVPEGLCWLSTEPDWQAMVEGRIGSVRVLRRRVTFRYAADFSVSASLAFRVQGVGLSCGGSFEEMKAVEREYVVEFYPRGPHP